MLEGWLLDHFIKTADLYSGFFPGSIHRLYFTQHEIILNHFLYTPHTSSAESCLGAGREQHHPVIEDIHQSGEEHEPASGKNTMQTVAKPSQLH